jgi:DNA-binding transcriptional ArsR family regulator
MRRMSCFSVQPCSPISRADHQGQVVLIARHHKGLDIFILLGEYMGMDLDDTFVALADDTRRKILSRLAAGEARVTEVAAPFDISLNSVSKHIRLLERAGLVSRRVAGRDHFLALEKKPFDQLTDWMLRTREFWSSRLDLLESRLRAEDAIAAAAKSSNRTVKRKRP